MNRTIARSAARLLMAAAPLVEKDVLPGDALRLALPNGTTVDTMSARQRRATELAHALLLRAARSRGAVAADALVALGQLKHFQRVRAFLDAWALADGGARD